MASSVDTSSSPPYAQEISNVSSPFTKGDDALASSIASSAIPGQSPRKPFVETQSPRSSSGSDHGGSGNAADVSAIIRGKKPAWNVPSNSAIEVGSVMDTISWPALSEAARATPKSSSSDSLKPLPDGSMSALPVSMAQSPSSKQSSNNQNLNSTHNSHSFRDKNIKRGAVTGGGGSISGSSNVGLATPSSSPVLTEASQSVPGKQPSLENSPRGLPNQGNSGDDNERDHYSKISGFSSHSQAGNDHQRNHGGGRRGSNGHHGNYGNRRDWDRGAYEWSHRNIGRGVRMQQMHQQRGVGPYPRAPLAAAPFIAPPPPVRPFSNHMGFSEFQSPIYYVAAPPHPESLRGVPFAAHPAPTPQVMFFPAADPQRAMLLKQIDYYFSPENLCKDLYLRQNMDEEGWVSVSLIAGFNRVKQLTNNIQYIVDSVQLSNVVEVQGDKIRKRNDWMAWVLHPADNFVSASGQPSSIANFDGLETLFDNVNLDLDTPKNTALRGLAKNEAAFARSASVKLSSSQMPLRNSDDADVEVGTYSDRIWNMRTLLRSDTM